jgi:hypothetical protein
MELALVGNEALVIDNLNTEALAEWIEYREDKKKPLSKLALKKTQNLMLKFDPAQQQLMVDTAVMNDWQGLHAVDPPKANTTRDRSLQQDLTDTSWAGL